GSVCRQGLGGGVGIPPRRCRGHEYIEPLLLHARVTKVGLAGLEPATPCSQGRRSRHCATPRNWLWRQDSNLQLSLVNSQALCRLSYTEFQHSRVPWAGALWEAPAHRARGLDLQTSWSGPASSTCNLQLATCNL